MNWFFLALAIFFVGLAALWMYNAIESKSYLFGIVSLLCLVLAGIDFYRAIENRPTNMDVRAGRAVYQTETVQKNDSTWVVTFTPVWKDEVTK